VIGRSTAFPVSIARGATWDPELEEQVGGVIGAEARAQGANFFGGVCINLPRHPAWGRVQETYGEDPVLLGEMGAALVRGTQRHVMACVKHYALNSMENARFTVDVTCDEATLQEVYLAHFRRVVEEGVAAVMTAYNSVNGEWCGQNEALLEGVLRRDWGFAGVTVSDFVWGFRDAAKSLAAGLDVEEPFRQQRGRDLVGALNAGTVTWEHVERAGVRSLATQLRSLAAVQGQAQDVSVVAGPEHRALAREVARRSMVLLRNEQIDGVPLLPLDPSTVRSLAVVGRIADLPNTGDQGSSNVRAPEVVSPLAGLRAALPEVELRHVPDDADAAAAAAVASDVAVVVVGYTAADEGEYVSRSAYVAPDLAALYPPTDDPDALKLLSAMAGDPEGKSMVGGKAAGGDRARLRLRPEDEELIERTAAANPRTIVVLVTAGAVLMEDWRSEVPALLVAWYAGMEGGAALADVLLGRADPSGRLPFSIPTAAEHLPSFDRDATHVVYDRWFGQRLLDRLGVEAAYPLGFGLSYSAFEVADAQASQSGQELLDVSVTVSNTSGRDGRHVVQVYGSCDEGDLDPEDRRGEVLLGFASVPVPAGEARRVEVAASLRPLSRWDSAARHLVVPTGALSITVGSYAGDPDAARARVDLGA
jgi:beta-glucosidase